ncbi:MAG: FHA domain-containing protein [Pyrinomonadaceae bacterium]
MSENTAETKKSFSLDWLIRGALTKFGDIFDTLTGRRWKPSSSLATSELTEKLKKLLDTEAKDLGGKGKFVPHNLKLKMQWDKFSTDSANALSTLQNELLIAAIDHINDNRYQTYEPINLEVKPDYFTEGVKLIASFDKIGKEEHEAAVNVTVPDIKVGNFAPEPVVEPSVQKEIYHFKFVSGGQEKDVNLEFAQGTRRSVGRNKQNDLMIGDNSVSKIHATLVLNKENQMQVADTGSTNGTFINGQRISYGKAMAISDTDQVKFGTIDVSISKEIRAELFEPESIQTTSDDTEVLLNSEQLKSGGQSASTEKNYSVVTNQNTLQNEPKLEFALPDQVSQNESSTKQEIVFDFENQSGGNEK